MSDDQIVIDQTIETLRDRIKQLEELGKKNDKSRTNLSRQRDAALKERDIAEAQVRALQTEIDRLRFRLAEVASLPGVDR